MCQAADFNPASLPTRDRHFADREEFRKVGLTETVSPANALEIFRGRRIEPLVLDISHKLSECPPTLFALLRTPRFLEFAYPLGYMIDRQFRHPADFSFSGFPARHGLSIYAKNFRKFLLSQRHRVAKGFQLLAVHGLLRDARNILISRFSGFGKMQTESLTGSFTPANPCGEV
jgi:hypothetical protein